MLGVLLRFFVYGADLPNVWLNCPASYGIMGASVPRAPRSLKTEYARLYRSVSMTQKRSTVSALSDAIASTCSREYRHPGQDILLTDMESVMSDDVFDEVNRRIREAVTEANTFVSEGESDIWDGVDFSPESLSHVIMMHMRNPDLLTNDDKRFWLSVAIYMGPDWVSKFSKVAAFMRRVEDFEWSRSAE